jgi:hypothetical protein
MAMEMRRAGQNDGAILLALSMRGLPPEDAEAVVRSLGGASFKLAPDEYLASEWSEGRDARREKEAQRFLGGRGAIRGILAFVLLLAVLTGAVTGKISAPHLFKLFLFMGIGVFALGRWIRRAR